MFSGSLSSVSEDDFETDVASRILQLLQCDEVNGYALKHQNTKQIFEQKSR
jgi:hypothetical protein